MRVLAAVIVATLMNPSAAESRGFSCEVIRDADQRNSCRAVTSGRLSYCELIKNHDLRARCRVAVKCRGGRCYGD